MRSGFIGATDRDPATIAAPLASGQRDTMRQRQRFSVRLASTAL
jgi:hypothetical protein